MEENNRDRKKSNKNTSSKYKGVCLYQNKKYIATIKKNNIQ